MLILFFVPSVGGGAITAMVKITYWAMSFSEWKRNKHLQAVYAAVCASFAGDNTTQIMVN